MHGHEFSDYREWLRPLWEHLPASSSVLDLGCGCGVPTSLLLAERFRVTGVDISEVQIARARRYVPGATFLRQDMVETSFPPHTFAAIVCLYSLIHVPLAAQRPLLTRIHEWLVPSGWFIVITGHEAYEGIEENWLGSGAPMFWSHADAASYRAWLSDVGFGIRSEFFVPEGEGGHHLFQAQVDDVKVSSVPRPSP